MAALTAALVVAASAQLVSLPTPEPAQTLPAPTPAAPPLSAPATPVEARASDETPRFEAYKARLIERARGENVQERTIQANVPTLRLNLQAIELDRAQIPSSTPAGDHESLAPYLEKHVTPALILEGQRRYYSDWPQLVRIYQRYGVDPAILMAIFGQETHYGSVTGSFDLLEVLASLAFEGRRREMFEGEFIATLKLIDRGVPRERLKGSYAGAMGYPQFMPSLALRLRADGDGDGHSDIWNNEIDALASIANAFQAAGWRANIPWGSRVQVPATLDRNAIRPTTKAPRCAAVFRRHSRWMTVDDWRARGVMISGQSISASELTTLFEPNGPDGTGYLLTSNYLTILKYNCSNYYGMSVGLLSDGVARR